MVDADAPVLLKSDDVYLVHTLKTMFEELKASRLSIPAAEQILKESSTKKLYYG